MSVKVTDRKTPIVSDDTILIQKPYFATPTPNNQLRTNVYYSWKGAWLKLFDLFKADVEELIDTKSPIDSVADTASVDLDVTSGVLTADITDTAVTPSTYGDASNIPQITVDQKGRVTSVTDIPISLANYQEKRIVVSTNTTAVLDGAYTLVASATFTDPTPSEGKGYSVLIRNGTATIGAVAYSTVGTLIWRLFHSGSWDTYVLTNQTQLDTKQSKILSVDLAASQTTSSNVVGNITSFVSPTLEANKTYYVTGRMIIGCSGAGGVRLAASFSGATVSLAVLGSASGFAPAVSSIISVSGTLTSAMNTNGANQTFVYINGTIVVGTSPMTIQMQFASGTNGQTSTIYGANNVLGFGNSSYLVFTPKD